MHESFPSEGISIVNDGYSLFRLYADHRSCFRKSKTTCSPLLQLRQQPQMNKLYKLFIMVAQLWLHLSEVPRLPRGLSRRLPRALRRLISECVQTHALRIAVAHQTASAPHQLAPSTSSRYLRRRPAVWKLRRSAEQQAMPRLHRLGLHRLLLAPRPVERLAMERPTIPPSSPRRC